MGALPADETSAYTHDCTVLADSSHGDSHVGSVSPAATRTLTLALTLTLTLTLTLALTDPDPYPHPNPSDLAGSALAYLAVDPAMAAQTGGWYDATPTRGPKPNLALILILTLSLTLSPAPTPTQTQP